jgi:VanZ family protein
VTTKIAVVGLGYVGLSIAVLLSQHNDVVGLEIDERKLRLLEHRTSPIHDAEIEQFLGLEPQQGYAVIEFTANIALFVPLGVLMLLWWRQRSWWHATAVAFATSLTIEVLQQLVRPERYASAQDVVANTLGGTIGGLLIVAGRRLSRRRRRRAAR